VAEVASAREDHRHVALISGGDLIAAGYPPGPRFKEILAQVEDAQLEGEIQTREQAREHVKNRFREKGATRPQGQGETADKGTRS